MRDLPALWAGEEWLADVEAWLLPALAAAGRSVTGPLVREHVRFWSAVLRVETDGGRVWVKENAPSQGFEAGLLPLVERLAPGRTAPVVAVDPERGRLATADLGAPLGGREVPDDAWAGLVSTWAGLQRDLVGHDDALLATGLRAFPESEATCWAAALADRLHALPAEHPLRVEDAERRHVDAGLPLLEAAAAELAASGLPASLQHNDLHLGNALASPDGSMAFIDLADAVWANPLTAARLPRWILSHRLGDPQATLVRRAADAAVEPWTDLAGADDLLALLPAADRLSSLHRAVSWQRLLDDVPVDVVPQEWVGAAREWLLVATDPDPFAAAVGDRHAR